MKSQRNKRKYISSRNQIQSYPMNHDLIPYIDKPGIRRAVRNTTLAGGLLLGTSSEKAEAALGPFLLRSVDGPKAIQPAVATSQGDARPYLGDVDADGDLDLIQILPEGCGGYVPPSLYENTGTAFSRKFRAARTIDTGDLEANTSNTVWADFDGDGDDDQAVLKTGGYFENIGSIGKPDLIERLGEANPLHDLGFYPMEAADLNGDGYADLIDENLGIHENIESEGSRGFTQEAVQSFEVPADTINNVRVIVCGDLDGDGDFDALVFSKSANSNYYFENTGDTETPRLVHRGEGLPADVESGIFGGLPGSGGGTPLFTDVDSDGDMDAKIGSAYFRNTGTRSEPLFIEDGSIVEDSFSGVPYDRSADLDGDGIQEEFNGQADGSIQMTPPTEVQQTLASEEKNPLSEFRFSDWPGLSFVDIDSDGDDDLFVGNSRRVYFLENVSISTNDTDTDGDGLPDGWENGYFGGIAFYGGNDDPDADGLTNSEEALNYTDPNAADTDGDGFLDNAEVKLGTLPLIPSIDPPITLTPASPEQFLKVVGIGLETVRFEGIFRVGAQAELLHSTDLFHWSPLDLEITGTGDVQDVLINRSNEEAVGFYTFKSKIGQNQR